MSDICNAVLAFHACLIAPLCADTADKALFVCDMPSACDQIHLYECTHPDGRPYYLTEEQVRAHDSGVQK